MTMRPLLVCLTFTALLLQIEAQERVQGEDLDDSSEQVDLFQGNHSCHWCIDYNADKNSNRNENGKVKKLCANNILDVFRCGSRLNRECFDDSIPHNVSYCRKSKIACSYFDFPDCSTLLTDGSAPFGTSLLLLSTSLIIFLVMSESCM